MSETKTVEIELRSKDDAKLAEIWSQLREYLAAHNPGLPYSPFEHIVRELVFNSIKANLKRIFLEQNGEGAVDAPDFREALENFSPELLQQAESSQYHVRVRFAALPAEGGFEVSVENNTAMLPAEKQLVDRLLSADPAHDASSGESASGEGGGLGLSMVGKILQNCGMERSALQYESNQASTQFRLRVPAGTA